MKPEGMMGLRRAIRLMETLTRNPQGSSFSALQRELDDLPAPTLSRLLKTMLDEGWVARNSRENRYGLGTGFLKTACMAISGLSRGELVQPVIDELASVTGESAAYLELDGDSLHMVAKREQADSWHYMDVGQSTQRFSHSAFAQVCIAYEAPERQRHFYDIAEQPHTISWETFCEHMSSVREGHVLIDDGESLSSAFRIVAPVIDCSETDRVLGAIGISLITRPADDAMERYVGAVKDAAHETLRRILSGINQPR